MKKYLGIAAVVAGFTVCGDGSETLVMTGVICAVKIALIMGGGLVTAMEIEREEKLNG